jgi:hypothetical protein
MIRTATKQDDNGRENKPLNPEVREIDDLMGP